MNGIQQTLFERLKELELCLRDGCYGENDEVDVEAFRDDLLNVAATV